MTMTADEIAQADHEERHPRPETSPFACLDCHDFEFEVAEDQDETCPICGGDNVEAI